MLDPQDVVPWCHAVDSQQFPGQGREHRRDRRSNTFATKIFKSKAMSQAAGADRCRKEHRLTLNIGVDYGGDYIWQRDVLGQPGPRLSWTKPFVDRLTRSV